MAGCGTFFGPTTNTRDSDITVASYYFGQYHPNDPRNMKVRGGEWSEWELIKAAKPRFPGHQQPKVPLWGYEDESDPNVMAKKIDAAVCVIGARMVRRLLLASPEWETRGARQRTGKVWGFS